MATLEEIAQMAVDDFNNRTYQQNAANYNAESVVVIDEPTGQEMHGIEGSIMSSDRWVQALPDAHAEVVSHEVNSRVVTTTIRGTGTFTGQMTAPDGSVIPGNGNPLDMNYVQELEIVDGMIVRMTARYDMQDMMSQLGLG